MSNAREDRWLMRFDNYERALSRLRDGCQQDEYSELEVAGLVHTFGFTFNLAANVLKDLLFYEGIEVNSPRQAIKGAFAAGLISEEDGTVLLEALLSRNVLEHIYDEEQAMEAIALIKNGYLPVFERIYADLDARRAK